MQIFNSLGRRKEEFVPINENDVKIYVCGITAYDYCHIGHARSAIVFDTLVRHLRNKGYKTTFIRNFTDIDDKIINKANSEQRDWKEVGETYMRAFHEDMDRLGVARPDMEPKATDYIPQIIALCEKLIQTGRAYASPGGDVYFRVRDYKPYGKLSGRAVDELLAGARVAVGEEKEDALDFALWKAAKPGEPSWPSPWGPGRPGWHIECSAMSLPYLPLDIHGGGQDLVFPHHENEIAQSEAATGGQLAKYWAHNGFVQINSEKMAKSLGNFKTIREILENWLPETLRFFLLGKHYRSPVDFSESAMEEAEKGVKRVYSSLKEASEALKQTSFKKGALPEALLKEWALSKDSFEKALDDDLNTAQAIGHIFSDVRLVNRILEDKSLRKLEGSRQIYQDFLERAKYWESELGLFGKDPADFLDSLREAQAKRLKLDREKLADLLEKRKTARLNKDYALSDKYRDEIASLGVLVKDTPAGQTWDFA